MTVLVVLLNVTHVSPPSRATTFSVLLITPWHFNGVFRSKEKKTISLFWNVFWDTSQSQSKFWVTTVKWHFYFGLRSTFSPCFNLNLERIFHAPPLYLRASSVPRGLFKSFFPNKMWKSSSLLEWYDIQTAQRLWCPKRIVKWNVDWSIHCQQPPLSSNDMSCVVHAWRKLGSVRILQVQARTQQFHSRLEILFILKKLTSSSNIQPAWHLDNNFI